jgi:hypothetical protein
MSWFDDEEDSGDSWYDSGDGGGDSGGGFFESVGSFFSDAASAVGDFVGAAVQKVEDVASSVINTVKDFPLPSLANVSDVASKSGLVDGLINAGLKFAGTAVVSYLVTKAVTPSQPESNTPTPTPNPGTHITLQPASRNTLSIVYGLSWTGTTVVDAMISADNKTMWYVMAVCEAPETTNAFGGGSLSFEGIKWGDYILNMSGTTVTSWTDSAGNTDTKPNGLIDIWTYGKGSSNPLNSTSNAWDVLSDSAIPANLRWSSSDSMSGCCFIVMRVKYDQTAGITGMPSSIRCHIRNTIHSPGSVIYDYLSNTRYGCSVSDDNIDIVSLQDLDDYSSQTISYTDSQGNPATSIRYSIDGVLQVTKDNYTNLNTLCAAADSWLQWKEATGKWGVVINKAYNQGAGSQTAQSLAQLFAINDDNVMGGIDFTPTDLNSNFNNIEATYYDLNLDNQQSSVFLNLNSAIVNPNEPMAPFKLDLPYCNTYFRAQYIAERKLLQNREDLVTQVTLDFSGLQVDAGDLVRVTNDKYKWVDKVFRVTQVTEAKNEDIITVQLNLMEYNHQIYENIDLQDFVPESDSGLSNPAAIEPPSSLFIEYPTSTNGTTNTMVVGATVPAQGIVTSMDFYSGTNPDPITHSLYKALTSDNGTNWSAGDIARLTVNSLLPNSVSIVGITKAVNAVVSTSVAHGLANGDIVYLDNVGGMTNINGQKSPVSVISPTSFALNNINSVLYNTYTSGGKVQRPVFFSVKATTTTGPSSGGAGISSAPSTVAKATWAGSGVTPSGINSSSITNNAVSETVSVVIANNPENPIQYGVYLDPTDNSGAHDITYRTIYGFSPIDRTTDPDPSTPIIDFVEIYSSQTVPNFIANIGDLSYPDPAVTDPANGYFNVIPFLITNGMTLNTGDKYSIDATFSAVQHWLTDSTTTVVGYELAIFEQLPGTSAWIKKFQIYDEGTNIITSNPTAPYIQKDGYFPVIATISGLDFTVTTASGLYKWAVGVSYTLAGGTGNPSYNTPNQMNLYNSNIKVTRLRK